MKVLVTGSAGFIGSAVAQALLQRGDSVVGIDNLNPYYSVDLKRARLARLSSHDAFTQHTIDLADQTAVAAIFARERPDRVVHLAAQAGVRYAAENPHVYVSSNIVGFLHVLEGCRHYGCEHLVYASTSSVYGANPTLPFDEAQSTEHPLTLYAASKKANEMMAHSYAHLFNLPCTGLRFFTVYGPWGRPDMALFKFARAILDGKPIQLFNHGQHSRSFTYIDDIVEGIVRVLDQPAGALPAADALDAGTSPVAPYRIYNIGSEDCVPLIRYIELLEQCLGKSATRELLPLQPGDVPDTAASVARLFDAVGYRPQVKVETGVARFVEWFLAHPELTG